LPDRTPVELSAGRADDASTGPVDGAWIDDFLLAGPDRDVCLWFDRPVSRGELRDAVAARAAELVAAGLRPGGAVSLRLPPSLGYVVNLLASWRIGAQVSLLDHRLTDHEVARAVDRIRPQLVVSAAAGPAGGVRSHSEITAVIAAHPGEPAATPHALLQLSSGSTGPSKVIGRTAADLLREIARYHQIDGTPLPGERVVLLASMVHVLGLVGGLLYCLRTGVQLVLPRALTTDAILAAIGAGAGPTTVIGVPFHIDFLTVAGAGPRLPQLKRMTVGGELVRPTVRQSFMDRYDVPLGNMYGMTEVGVIATDLFGRHQPALEPAPGMILREEAGQLLLARHATPYVGLSDPTRWVDGWLYTRDAGTVDPDSGLVTVRGRLDSQVSVAGLKVDLTEVEQTLAGLTAVVEVVVAHDAGIVAFVALADGATEQELKSEMARLLAPYKRPRRLTLLPKLPRTATGKLVRSIPVLRDAAARAREIPKPRTAAPAPAGNGHQEGPAGNGHHEERIGADVQ
jgi:acyl-coenzyme A synthetase/AMP-(fatty) acid ligase